MYYEITDKGKDRLEDFKEKSQGPSNIAEGEILYWLDRSSEEGNKFLESNKNTWRTDPLGRMRRSGLIDRVEED